MAGKDKKVGVINNSDRLYNLRAMNKKTMHTVRLSPGYNLIEESTWKPFEKEAQVKELVKGKILTVGEAAEIVKESLEEELINEAQTKVETVPDNVLGSDEEGL